MSGLCSTRRALRGTSEALELFDRALTLAEDDRDSHLRAQIFKIEVFIDLKRFNGALECYELALPDATEEKDILTINIKKDHVLFKLERYEEVIPCCDEVIHRDPKSLDTHVRKGKALFKLEQIDKVDECFNDVLRLTGSNDQKNRDAACELDVIKRLKQKMLKEKRKQNRNHFEERLLLDSAYPNRAIEYMEIHLKKDPTEKRELYRGVAAFVEQYQVGKRAKILVSDYIVDNQLLTLQYCGVFSNSMISTRKLGIKWMSSKSSTTNPSMPSNVLNGW